MAIILSKKSAKIRILHFLAYLALFCQTILLWPYHWMKFDEMNTDKGQNTAQSFCQDPNFFRILSRSLSFGSLSLIQKKLYMQWKKGQNPAHWWSFSPDQDQLRF